MFKINLVPEVQEKKNQAQKMNATAVTIAVVIMGITVVALILITLAKTTLGFQVASTEKKIESVKQESEQYKELEETVVSLEKGLAGIKQIYDGKNQWPVLMGHLESATPSEVQYKSLKISAGAIDAEVSARNIEALAKSIDSYKNYKILTITGSGKVGEDLSVKVDGGEVGTIKVKSTGVWVTGVHLDFSKDHEIKVGKNEQFVTISYKAEGEKVEGTDGSTGTVKALFSSVESKAYEKAEGGRVRSNIKFNFDGSALW